MGGVDRLEANGESMEFVYDAQHRLLSYNIEGRDALTVQIYGADGRLESVIDDGGVRITQTSDPGALVLTEIGPDPGLSTTSTYDSRGRLASTAQDFLDSAGNPQSDLTRFTYTADDLLASRTLPSGAVESWEYDSAERVIRSVDASGVVRETEYGPFSQPSLELEGGEVVQRTEFGPLGGVMAFGYDTLGRKTAYTDKLGKTVRWTYDETGRELSRTNRNGEVLTRTYDRAGRLATMSGTGVDRELRYDPLDRLVFGREGAHITEQDWDARGVTDVRVYGTDTAGHVTAAWQVVHDGAGRLVDLVGPIVGGDIAMEATHTYDSRGRLSSVSELGIGTFGFGYDAAGRRSTLTRPGNIVTTTSYDGSGRTTGIATVDGVGALVHEIRTTYDSRGIPATQTDPEGTQVYSHDQRGRLIGVDHPAGAQLGDESYSYDQAERRVSSHRDAASEVVYDAGDRLVQDASFVYSYDDEGRRISRTDRVSGAVTTYRYSDLDQLLSLEEGGERWEFVYDARELRVLVRQQVGGLEVYGESFVYDLNGTVRGVYGTDGVRTAAYVAGFGFGEVLGREDGRTALRDRLGTTVGWVGAGGVSGLVVRDGYGARGASVGVVPFGYTGHAEDGTGLVWGRARMLEPIGGIWLTGDRDVLEPRVTYVVNRPSIMVDPTGNESILYAGISKTTGEVISLATRREAMMWLLQDNMRRKVIPILVYLMGQA